MKNNIHFDIFIDEFGNVLEKYPKKPFGYGVFVCREKDLENFDEKFRENFPQKTHLMKSKSREELQIRVKSIETRSRTQS